MNHNPSPSRILSCLTVLFNWISIALIFVWPIIPVILVIIFILRLTKIPFNTPINWLLEIIASFSVPFVLATCLPQPEGMAGMVTILPLFTLAWFYSILTIAAFLRFHILFMIRAKQRRNAQTL
ncbi:hypothetical protein JD969_12800 [Planctomycetota bacterium]|nr:hypothetical protein JD969_12800 [Planctomycetota bacterium]